VDFSAGIRVIRRDQIIACPAGADAVYESRKPRSILHWKEQGEAMDIPVDAAVDRHGLAVVSAPQPAQTGQQVIS